MDARRLTPVEQGQKIRNFQFVDILGRGAQAEVWQAIDLFTNRAVAVKLIISQSITQEDTSSSIGAPAQDWNTEANLWTLVSGHPNVITLFSYSKESIFDVQLRQLITLDMFVMELAEQTLFDYIKANRIDDWSRPLTWMIQIASGLAAAHANDPPIKHRDIKPQNVLLVSIPNVGLTAKLSDFGIARLVTQSTSRAWVGTPPYAAPEQWDYHSEIQSDIHQLGMTFLHLVTGSKFHNVLRGDQQQKIFLRSAVKDVIPALEEEPAKKLLDLIESMTSKNIQSRPTILQVMQKLEVIKGNFSTQKTDLVEFPTKHRDEVTRHTEINRSLRNRFIWHPILHKTFQETLYYYWISGFFSVKDMRSSIRQLLDNLVEDAYSIYSVYGSDDILLRVWLNETIEGQFDGRIKMIRDMLKGRVERFRADEMRYLWAESDGRFHVLPENIDDELRKIFTTPSAPEESPLVLKELKHVSEPGVKVFTRVRAFQQKVEKDNFEHLIKLVRRIADGDNSGIEHIACYLGSLESSGSGSMLIKYHARSYYDVYRIPYAIHEDAELSQLVIRTNTYLVMSLPLSESDDGPFLYRDHRLPS